ncbi:hypothetical protein CDD81_1536 [Ophiocordyceps australis]|uniref:Uncharacterized protein n=1 Tax=Ophiocordyceps australis TaxID=1399860 RepID=A0A2C5Y0R9_9HYPO|nr:hypothetical protein CDD81_1536 [Ophiocordyceps australis]
MHTGDLQRGKRDKSHDTVVRLDKAKRRDKYPALARDNGHRRLARSDGGQTLASPGQTVAGRGRRSHVTVAEYEASEWAASAWRRSRALSLLFSSRAASGGQAEALSQHPRIVWLPRMLTLRARAWANGQLREASKRPCHWHGHGPSGGKHVMSQAQGGQSERGKKEDSGEQDKDAPNVSWLVSCSVALASMDAQGESQLVVCLETGQ